MEKRYFKYKGAFRLESGKILPDPEICYHISKEFPGREAADRQGPDDQTESRHKKVIWITHALTASSDPSDWWEVLVGEGKFFDPRKYTIVCANILGSCYGTTGGASLNPVSGRPYMLDFPRTTVRDIAACHERLRQELGIEQIDLLIGGSVGGFQAIEWSILHPSAVKNLILLACNARITPWGSAFNESQRMALHADPTFGQQLYGKGDNHAGAGNTFSIKGGQKGLAAARSIALISYRSYSGYNISQMETDPETLFDHRAHSYQRYQGEKLVKRFDAYSYLSMLNLTDSHNIGRGRQGTEAALQRITARVLCIGIDSDHLFPPSEQRYMAEKVRRGEFKLIHSKFGHDGFLLEWQQIKDTITGWGWE